MYRKIIKVFLGSPGDLENERKAAKVIVDEENANHANELGYHIDLVGWEDTVSQRRRAQAAINVDLDQCEYFVGLMWKKWGTPPGPEGHPFSSGFEEEYSLSVDRHEKTGKPEISLLFRTIPKDDLIDVGKQLEKVLDFQENINLEKKQYYQKFSDLRDFEQKFRAIISKFLRDQQLEDRANGVNDPQKPKPEEQRGEEQQSAAESKYIFEDEARKFLGEFFEKQELEHAYTAADAARFRLIACTVSQPGNDTLVLGAHDANLIYRDRKNVDLSKREKRFLLSAGLENFGSSTVPLWHWLYDKDVVLRKELPIRTILSSDKRSLSAFQILGKLSIAPENFEGPIGATEYLDLWFAEGTSDNRIVAAIEYLGAVGDHDINIEWAKLIGNSEANIATAAVRAKARITSRFSSNQALRFVGQHDSVDLGQELTESLLKNISSIETDVLRGCLNNRTQAFVTAIATELSKRAALTKRDAETLCESAHADIRLIGVSTLAILEPVLTLSDAREVLVKPPKTNSLNLFAQLGNFDHHGESKFEEYKIGLLSNFTYDDLLDLQKDQSFFSTEVELAIYSSHFGTVKAQLEEDLIDGFESYCSDKRDQLSDTEPKPTLTMLNFVRDKLLQSAFEIYCSKSTFAELGTVRKVFDNHEIKFATGISDFFAKYGEWQDAVRLAKLSGKPKGGLGSTLLTHSDNSGNYRVAAKSILKLGSKRVADALRLELIPPLKVQVVLHIPKNQFAAFEDQSIVELLHTDNEQLREVVALKVIQNIPKSRQIKILDAYYSTEGTHYYNVIYWLDLGISADRATSKAVAFKELATK